MTWIKLDDGFPEHRKVQPLSDKAFRLHITAMCSAARRLSDGHLSNLDVEVCRIVANRANGKHIQELEERGLWKSVNGGWLINDYLEFNPSADKVKADRQRWAEHKRKTRSPQ